MSIRRATPDDVGAIAPLHAWGDALTVYAAEDDQQLQVRLLAEKKTLWRSLLATPPKGQRVFVAEHDADVVGGFVSAGPSEESGKVFALFVAKHLWGQGVGRRLLSAAEQHLTATEDEAYLWVVAGNCRARRFYGQNGWSATGREKLVRGTPFVRYIKTMLGTARRSTARSPLSRSGPWPRFSFGCAIIADHER